MSSFLRLVKLPNWIDRTKEGWLFANDIPADPLSDLATNQNGLSLWQVEGDESTRERLFAAIAATNKDRAANIDFVLFEESVLTSAGVNFRRTPGGTPDEEINSKFHYDAIQISADTLVRMIKVIYRGWSPDRLDEDEVRGMICNSYRQGWLDASKLKPKLRSAIADLCK